MTQTLIIIEILQVILPYGKHPKLAKNKHQCASFFIKAGIDVKDPAFRVAAVEDVKHVPESAS